MTIKLYWWRGEGALDPAKQNFGDYLSPLIVEMVSGRPVEYAPPESADMIAIGSILSRERKARRFLFRRRLHIWGTGTDSAERRFPGLHYYHAVRGVKTREQIKKLTTNPALGDPGLLADHWWSGRSKVDKKHRVGLIPHFVDQADPRATAISKLPGVALINVFDPVETVLREIQACDFVLSSSMHGLIVADAFGIPNRRIVFSSGIISELKFDDYYSAFGMLPPQPLDPGAFLDSGGALDLADEPYSRPGIERVKRGLIDSFPSSL